MMRKRKTRSKLTMIVDGSNLAYRSYYKFEKLRTSSGLSTGLIYGFLRILNSYLIRFKPDYLVVTFDTKQSKSSNFRNELLETYKTHRGLNLKMDYQDFNTQLGVLKKILRYLSIPLIWDDKGLGHESDDYIAYLALNLGGRRLIVSSDKDFCQLLDKNIKIYNPSKEAIIRDTTCEKVMGYNPQQFLDFLILTGDTSDDIPGYKGIGEKRGKLFLDSFGSIEKFLRKSSNTFNGIDRDGLADLYRRNTLLINLKVGLQKYPITEIPWLHSKGMKQSKAKEIFEEYYLKSFMDSEFLDTFKNIDHEGFKNTIIRL